MSHLINTFAAYKAIAQVNELEKKRLKVWDNMSAYIHGDLIETFDICGAIIKSDNLADSIAEIVKLLTTDGYWIRYDTTLQEYYIDTYFEDVEDGD